MKKTNQIKLFFVSLEKQTPTSRSVSFLFSGAELKKMDSNDCVMRYRFFSISDMERFATSDVHRNLREFFMPDPHNYDWALMTELKKRSIYSNAWLHSIQHTWRDDSHPPQVLVLNTETNFYELNAELGQEITTFFDSIQTNNPDPESRFTNLERIDHLEIEGRPGPVEAGPANDAGLPGVGGPVIESPLDPFLIHPLIPLALALGLGLVLFLLFVVTKKGRGK
jgi:hypothetical protein